MKRRDDLLGLSKEKIDILREDIKALLERLQAKKYNPNQPRWPAGVPIGGQWRAAEGEVQVASFDEGRRAQCDLQRMLDEELCAMQLSSLCWDSAADRWNNCMRGVYVPPLRVGRR